MAYVNATQVFKMKIVLKLQVIFYVPMVALLLMEFVMMDIYGKNINVLIVVLMSFETTTQYVKNATQL